MGCRFWKETFQSIFVQPRTQWHWEQCLGTEYTSHMSKVYIYLGWILEGHVVINISRVTNLVISDCLKLLGQYLRIYYIYIHMVRRHFCQYRLSHEFSDIRHCLYCLQGKHKCFMYVLHRC